MMMNTDELWNRYLTEVLDEFQETASSMLRHPEWNGVQCAPDDIAGILRAARDLVERNRSTETSG